MVCSPGSKTVDSQEERLGPQAPCCEATVVNTVTKADVLLAGLFESDA